MESNIKGLVAAGHEMASELKAECGAVDMRSVAKLLSDLATQLEVQLVRANALAAENALARKAVQAFCDVVGDNTEVICEAVGRDGVLVILKAMKATGNMSATDAFLAEVRAQGVEMLAKNHQSIVNALKGDSLFSDGEYRHAIIASAATSFAAQLRKGGNQ
ncbi:TPA: eae-like domain protein [Escherichia coli]|nr:eae-like domain protein [Escherichia coli]